MIRIAEHAMDRLKKRGLDIGVRVTSKIIENTIQNPDHTYNAKRGRKGVLKAVKESYINIIYEVSGEDITVITGWFLPKRHAKKWLK